MINRNIFYVFFVFFLKNETSGEETVRGVLGGSVTFQLKTKEQFTLITWSTNSRNKDFDLFTSVLTENPGKFNTLLPAFRGRLNFSEDCKTLQVSHLVQADSGAYKAQIQISEGEEPLRETFGLKVYRNLSEADLTVHCDKGGNGSLLQLNCSAGPWEDGVAFSWASASKSGVPTPGRSLSIRHNLEDSDLNVTCTARNPVGSASKTVSLRKCCDGGGTADKDLLGAKLAGIVAGVLLGIAAIFGIAAVAVYLWQKKKGGAHVNDQGSARNPEPKDCTTVYALVGNAPEPTTTQKTKQRREPTKPNKDSSHTVYTAVHHPKQNSLETDDEKMQKEAQGGTMKDGDKTVYSEIKLQENEDEHIKTVYETVNHPKLPKAQEYNHII